MEGRGYRAGDEYIANEPRPQHPSSSSSIYIYIVDRKIFLFLLRFIHFLWLPYPLGAAASPCLNWNGRWHWLLFMAPTKMPLINRLLCQQTNLNAAKQLHALAIWQSVSMDGQLDCWLQWRSLEFAMR